MKVKKYKELHDENHSQECLCHRRPIILGIVEDQDGDYVDIEDYEKLEKRIAELEVKIGKLGKQNLGNVNG